MEIRQIYCSCQDMAFMVQQPLFIAGSEHCKTKNEAPGPDVWETFDESSI